MKATTFLKVSTMSVALLSGAAVATVLVTADVAYAGKGNGGGNGGGNSGDNGAGSDKGNGASKAAGSGKRKDSAKAPSRGAGGKANRANRSKDPISAIADLFRKEKPAKVKRTVVATPKAAPSVSPTPKPKGNRLADTLGVHPSALGALNAANASPTALANASPDSRVGKIALYAEEVTVTRQLILELEAAQSELASLEVPERSIEEIDAALGLARDSKTSLEADLARLQSELAAAGGTNADIEGQITTTETSIEAVDAEIAGLEQERADGEAYAAAAGEVERLEGEVESQEGTQREALEAAANKEVTDEVETAVQKLLGIYEE